MSRIVPQSVLHGVRVAVLVLAASACQKSKPAAEGAATSTPRVSAMSSADAGSPGASFVDRARRCLEDLACPSAEAARLFVASDDAREPLSDCYRFLDGVGAPRDSKRARACLERMVDARCEGSSALLSRAELAAMRIDGIGGPIDIAGGSALFSTCYDDITKAAILEHASAKERDPKAPRLDLCASRLGTTIVGEECLGRRDDTERFGMLIRTKSIASSLDAEGKRLLLAANRAHAEYVLARVLFVYEVYRGGSLRNSIGTNVQVALEKERREELEAFSSFKAAEVSDEAAARATEAVVAALGAVETSTAAEKRELAKTDSTWKAYRDVEVAFYEHVFGPSQGAERVRRARLVQLARQRASDCAPP